MWDNNAKNRPGGGTIHHYHSSKGNRMTIFGFKVLVVDDEIAIQRFLRVALNGQGFIVSEANTGQDALQVLGTGTTRSDDPGFGLPDMDGVEVTRRLREWSTVPIIILSVREQEEDKIAALDAGADDYLTKPFGMGELLARIRTVMRRQSSRISEPIFTIGICGLTSQIGRLQ